MQNIIEYLNSKYFKDVKIEKEVKSRTKTLYDPLVEQQGIQKEKIEIIKNAIKIGMDYDTICRLTGVSVKEIEKVKHNNE